MSSQPPTSESQQHHIFDYLRVVSVRWPVVLMVFLIVSVSATVITLLMPKKYESKVLMEVRKNADFEVFQASRGEGSDPRFTTTQFEIIESKEILYPVIEKLGLEEKWRERYELRSREMVYRKLLKMVSPEEVRNSDLISIVVLDEDRNEAADIANAVAEQYEAARIRDEESWTERSLSSLQGELQKLRDKTEALRKKAVEIRIEHGITDVSSETDEDAVAAPETKTMLNVEEQVTMQRLKVAAGAATLKELERLSDDQIMRTTETLSITDQTITAILPAYQEAASEQAKLLKAGYGDKHPAVRAQTAKVESYLSQLRNQIGSLRTAQKAALEIDQQSLKSLEAELEKSQRNQQEARTKSASYYEAKSDYIQSKRVLEAAETRFNTQVVQRGITKKPVSIWEKAEPAESYSRPRVGLQIALGIFFGIVLGLGVAFFIEYLDTSVKTMEDIERYFGLPVLAVVPRGIGILMDLPRDTPDAEPYRILRTNIEFNKKSAEAKTLTLVSGGAGEGKSTTLVNLAYTFVQSGLRVLVIDADLRRPRQHAIFGVSNSKGLTDYLSKGVPLDELILETKVQNLDFLPSGKLPPGAIAMLNSRRMTDLIGEVKKRYDFVLLDAPPILGVSDTSVIVRAVDLTALVIQHRRFPRAMLLRVKDAVINAGGNLLGAVLNNVDIRLDQYYQYQTNYYGYHEGGEKASSKKPAARPSVPAASVPSRHSDRDEY
jgi:capsular exopolysaccharide synthesis family protein